MTSVRWKVLGRLISTITGQQGLTVNVQVRSTTERIASLGECGNGCRCADRLVHNRHRVYITSAVEPMALPVRTAACLGAPVRPLACGAPLFVWSRAPPGHPAQVSRDTRKARLTWVNRAMKRSTTSRSLWPSRESTLTRFWSVSSLMLSITTMAASGSAWA